MLCSGCGTPWKRHTRRVVPRGSCVKHHCGGSQPPACSNSSSSRRSSRSCGGQSRPQPEDSASSQRTPPRSMTEVEGCAATASQLYPAHSVSVRPHRCWKSAVCGFICHYEAVTSRSSLASPLRSSSSKQTIDGHSLHPSNVIGQRRAAHQASALQQPKGPQRRVGLAAGREMIPQSQVCVSWWRGPSHKTNAQDSMRGPYEAGWGSRC